MKKFNDIFRDYIGYILSVLVVLGYILTAIFVLSSTGKDVAQIIVDGFVIFVLGVLLSNTMGHQGLNDGDDNESVIQAKLDHVTILNLTEPFWQHTPTFCTIKNTTALKQERTRILNFATLRYTDYFDHDGRFIGKLIPKTGEMDAFVKKQNKAIHNAINLDITQITPADLITENAKANDPLARGRSKQTYMAQSTTKDMFTKIATGIFGGVYTAQFIGANMGEIGYRIVIAIILLAFGVVRYYANYRFVVNEHKDRIIMATHWLKEFKSMQEQGIFTQQEATT
jgi:hypothetical protein